MDRLTDNIRWHYPLTYDIHSSTIVRSQSTDSEKLMMVYSKQSGINQAQNIISETERAGEKIKRTQQALKSSCLSGSRQIILIYSSSELSATFDNFSISCSNQSREYTINHHAMNTSAGRCGGGANDHLNFELSKNCQKNFHPFGVEKPPFLKNLAANLIFRVPIISSVRHLLLNVVILSKNCNFLPCILI